MKVAFDTNAIINLCSNDEWVERVAQYFQENEDSLLYIVLYVSEELAPDSLTKKQQLNHDKLETSLTPDNQRYFTIGVSMIGGADVLRGDGAERLGIERIVLDKNSAYKEYSRQRKAKGLPPKDVRTWLNRNINQNDSVIFERAEQLDCDYVVSDNKDILRAKNSSCRPLKLADFVQLIS